MEYLLRQDMTDYEHPPRIIFKNGFLDIDRRHLDGESSRRSASVPAEWKPRDYMRKDACADACQDACEGIRLSVKVLNVSGEMLTLDVNSSMTISRLKQELERHWNVPPVCQQLTIGTMAVDMECTETLSCFIDPAAEEHALCLTMVASADFAVQALSNVLSAQGQLEALRALVCIHPFGGDAAVAAIIQCFSATEHDCHIRKAAAMALMEVIPMGGGVAMKELCAAFRSEPNPPEVRLQALHAFMHTVAEVDEQVIRCLGYCLQDDDEAVRSEAINQFAKAANADWHECIMWEIKAHWNNQNAFVRNAALQALAKVAEKGDHLAVGMVMARLDDHDDSTRCAALQALADMVEEGDEAAMLVVGARLEDRSAEVRCAAVEALFRIAEKGSSKAAALLKARLDDGELSVRELASEALSQIAKTGTDVMDVNAICSSHPYWPPWGMPVFDTSQAESQERGRRRLKFASHPGCQ